MPMSGMPSFPHMVISDSEYTRIRDTVDLSFGRQLPSTLERQVIFGLINGFRVYIVLDSHDICAESLILLRSQH